MLLPALEHPTGPLPGTVLSVAVVTSMPVTVNSWQRTALPTLTSAVTVSGWGGHSNHPSLERQKNRVKDKTGGLVPGFCSARPVSRAEYAARPSGASRPLPHQQLRPVRAGSRSSWCAFYTSCTERVILK